MRQNDRSLATTVQRWTRRITGSAPSAPAPVHESSPPESLTRRGHEEFSRQAARTESKLHDFLFLLAVCALLDPYRTMSR